MKKGILCGTDSKQEWLLPWWWSRYSRHNSFPVTFCDFGMSEEALRFCKDRGNVVPVEVIPEVAGREEVDPTLAAAWEACAITPIWEVRPLWFKKVFALLQSPYQRGIWIDLDCEILQPIDPLFEQCSPEAQIGVMREFSSNHLPRFHPEAVYNSGVVVFEHAAPLLSQWAEYALTLNHLFHGDETLLSHLIREMQIEVVELPPIYNWRLSQGLNLNAAIVHWIGSGGKEFIRQRGGFQPLLDQFYRDCGL